MEAQSLGESSFFEVQDPDRRVPTPSNQSTTSTPDERIVSLSSASLNHPSATSTSSSPIAKATVVSDGTQPSLGPVEIGAQLAIDKLMPLINEIKTDAAEAKADVKKLGKKLGLAKKTISALREELAESTEEAADLRTQLDGANANQQVIVNDETQTKGKCLRRQSNEIAAASGICMTGAVVSFGVGAGLSPVTFGVSGLVGAFVGSAFLIGAGGTLVWGAVKSKKADKLQQA